MRHAGSPSGRKIVARYVEYLIENPYDPSVKYARPKRKVMGKRSAVSPDMMWLNENFWRYFLEAELPEEKDEDKRSSCLRIGVFIVIRQVIV